MCDPAAYHFRVFYIEKLDSASKIYIYTPLLLKITTSCFFKLLPTQCATRQHNMLKYFTQNSDSAPYILQEALNRHNLLETGNIYSNYTLKNPAYFQFYLIAAIVAFYLDSNWFQSVSHFELDLKPQIPLDISSKWNSMQRNIVHKLFMIMIDLTQSYTCTQILIPKQHSYTPLYAPVERTPSF